LRAQLPALPLKSADAKTAAGEPRGFWQRAGDALGSIVKVSHDDGTPLGLADDRIARELAALDVAHAEAAVLAYDDVGREAALKRVDATLAARFDPGAPAVQAARTRLTALLASQAKGSEPRLGAALTELRNLRSVHSLQGGASTASPAHAASAAPAHTGSAAAPHEDTP
jgi:uroporphyrin-3 C-methyltransferase